MLGFLKQNLYNASPQIKEYAYKQFLLPSVEYCSAVWDPYHQGDVLKLEMIQHRAARLVLNKPWHRNQQNDSITDMLSSLTWPSLEDRRKATRLILLFKILRKLFVVPDRCLMDVMKNNISERSNMYIKGSRFSFSKHDL